MVTGEQLAVLIGVFILLLSGFHIISWVAIKYWKRDIDNDGEIIDRMLRASIISGILSLLVILYIFNQGYV